MTSLPSAITRLTEADAAYPALLREVAPPPPLDVRGALVDDDALAVAIVGSRRATPYGVEVAERLASELASRGVTIVSGFARGIDTAAHRGALAAGGRTLAVLGCGVDVVYPAENAPLVAQVAARGALLSQFPLGTPPVPQNFPARNRTLAGLALGVIVVEAAERSGALITAGFAGDLGREVFAIPGRITSESSRGANGLLQDGAKLVQHWMDIVSELPDRWRRAILDTATAGDAPAPLAGSDDERMLRALSVDEPQHIERLMARVEMPAARASAVLTALELGGFVRQLAGQRWIAIGARARRV
jgi:DNA processing protein